MNLNWATFTWGLARSAEYIPIWAKAMSFLVVIFPALDTISVFPLIAITLGDNIAVSIPAKRFSCISINTKKLCCRLFASVPPLVIAILVSDLSVTLQCSGVFGVYVAFIAPALLQFYSRREDPRTNVYSSRFSGEKYVFLVLLFGIIALGILVCQIRF